MVPCLSHGAMVPCLSHRDENGSGIHAKKRVITKLKIEREGIWHQPMPHHCCVGKLARSLLSLLRALCMWWLWWVAMGKLGARIVAAQHWDMGLRATYLWNRQLWLCMLMESLGLSSRPVGCDGICYHSTLFAWGVSPPHSMGLRYGDKLNVVIGCSIP